MSNVCAVRQFQSMRVGMGNVLITDLNLSPSDLPHESDGRSFNVDEIIKADKEPWVSEAAPPIPLQALRIDVSGGPMTRDELHRAIAEALEPNPSQMNSDDVKWWGIFYRSGKNAPSFYPLYFSTSESASARLLDAMPMPTLNKWGDPCVWWACKASPSYSMSDHGDRKTAILMAAAKWLNIEGELEL